MNIFQLIAKYRYHLLLGFFGIWMIFLDSNNLIYRWRMSKEIAELKKSIKVHNITIAELKFIEKSVLGNTRALEKFGRETYLMKKSDEDIYIITEPIPVAKEKE